MGPSRERIVDSAALAPPRLAFQAYRRFGKGIGHPAKLNILDCCTYALAHDKQEPLLFKDRGNLSG